MKNFKFKLRGKTLVVIDWANVYGWSRRLGWDIDIKKLFKYLKSHKEIYDIRFYFGKEPGNPKSESFHRKIKKIGYTLISKEVKWIPVKIDTNYFKKSIKNTLLQHGFKQDFFKIFFNQLKKDRNLRRRKCDFDCEIAIDVMKRLNEFDCLILFSGDGDYAALIQEVIECGKQAIVVAFKNALGKEYGKIKKGLYICSIRKLKGIIKRNAR